MKKQEKWHTLKNTDSRYSKGLKALPLLFHYPKTGIKSLLNAIRSFYEEGHYDKSTLAVKPLSELVNVHQKIEVANYQSVNGNVTSYELLVISSLIKDCKPKNLLEIGTFDGNTTLQMGLNSGAESTIHTIDLPTAENPVKSAKSDSKFIEEKEKVTRRYLRSEIEHKVVQHYGNSMNYDFTLFTKNGLLDFVFVDGGHSYDCVKKDTENSLNVLSSKGVIVWHDFSPLWNGVFCYLCELSKSLPLVHIQGTKLVYYKKS